MCFSCLVLIDADSGGGRDGFQPNRRATPVQSQLRGCSVAAVRVLSGSAAVGADRLVHAKVLNRAEQQMRTRYLLVAVPLVEW